MLLFKEIDFLYFFRTGSKPCSLNGTVEIIFSLVPYIENHLKNGGKSWDICKHLINLVEGIPNAKLWRNKISTRSIKQELTIDYLIKVTSELQKVGY